MPPNDDRAARLKAALRDNLRRRKTQARGRAEEPAEAAPPAPQPEKDRPER
ncbi:hypothetical protein HNR00_002781 [Methylorubrum rhodinum]|jgi:hypothetical protein|uniref:Uncharacterized protein n=1 Tax=Methylorubrum rhodinum TaxID=29428 RepID=A0A840ZMR4_9HYPH|nr:hypothetical protein [Methylorubrum rhodinum]MBB5758063.1 hypothetical protein [Methylorubrum rhodinum]